MTRQISEVQLIKVTAVASPYWTASRRSGVQGISVPLVTPPGSTRL